MVFTLIISLKELGKRRDARIPGFMSKYVYSEYWKTLLRLFFFKNNNLITLVSGKNLLINVDINSYKNLKGIKEFQFKEFYT